MHYSTDIFHNGAPQAKKPRPSEYQTGGDFKRLGWLR